MGFDDNKIVKIVVILIVLCSYFLLKHFVFG